MAIEAKSGRNTSALMKPLTPQGPLAAIVGASPLPRGQVVAKMWDYIRANNLQKPTDKRVILADAKLKLVFGKDECTMFEMNKFIAQYLK
ncbi:SWIB/MDM2 domain-containing protein [Sandarakinorhabdus limnophila]|jgi:chromatin remodeling complex protein RSC6|uniref:SWIB/MDM2 domain-containing protein n=1 Tax=Sandarakinorhabdus limnophila TaxID=210512 RepID=UPI0026E92846|nr:SWIB/MDM2 domain-containing protein [Sandarakinorhabdus limnophila]